MTDPHHYSIDLETLNNRFDSAILSIGVVQFDPSTGRLGGEFYKEIDIDSAIKSGTVSGDTLAWWMEQGDKARRIFSRSNKTNKVSLATALDELAAWLRGKAVAPKVWGNGSSFDITILEHAYAKGGVGLAPPWHYTNVRDMRTIVDVSGLMAWPLREGTHHNALDDARYQAQVISACWQLIHGAPAAKGKSKAGEKKPAPAVEDEEL
jgi:hypothetical protein